MNTSVTHRHQSRRAADWQGDIIRKENAAGRTADRIVKSEKELVESQKNRKGEKLTFLLDNNTIIIIIIFIIIILFYFYFYLHDD
jgi:uncharacterized membrane protein